MPDRKLARLAALLHHRWSVPVLAALLEGSGAKFVTLARRLDLSRDSLRRTLDVLIAQRWVMRNPGHGHPMRPEYLLTAAGARIAPWCHGLLRALSRLGLDYMQCYCAVPYPKTEFGELARKNGWIQAEKWSQYDFGGDSILHTDTMTPKDITYFRRKAFRHFYFRPLFILKTLKETKIRRFFNLLKFAKWIKTKN